MVISPNMDPKKKLFQMLEKGEDYVLFQQKIMITS